MALTPSATSFDAADAARVASFWAAALGGSVGDEPTAEFAQVTANGTMLCFSQVPESKDVKNRVHLDLTADDLDAEVARLQSLGATVFAVYADGGRWTTMRDVEGNEFCVVAA